MKKTKINKNMIKLSIKVDDFKKYLLIKIVNSKYKKMQQKWIKKVKINFHLITINNKILN